MAYISEIQIILVYLDFSSYSQILYLSGGGGGGGGGGYHRSHGPSNDSYGRGGSNFPDRSNTSDYYNSGYGNGPQVITCQPFHVLSCRVDSLF